MEAPPPPPPHPPSISTDASNRHAHLALKRPLSRFRRESQPPMEHSSPAVSLLPRPVTMECSSQAAALPPGDSRSTSPSITPASSVQVLVAQEVGRPSSKSRAKAKRKAPASKHTRPSTAKRQKSPMVTIVRSPGIRIMMSPILRSPSSSSEEAIRLENHLLLRITSHQISKAKVAEMLFKTFGDFLCIPSPDPANEFPSPEPPVNLCRM
uniref:Uncharacterized protein n=1 Tax=Leersia perrieri TaxID=77586 RepID=A0A0D9WIH9_9ORYZ